MNISVIGLGKLGAPLSAVFASKGHTVVGVDINESFVAALNAGRPPVEEPGLTEMIAANRSRLSATMDTRHAVATTDVTFIIVPTPSDPAGGFSVRYVLDAVKEIGRALADKSGFHLVVLTSTVMPGATDAEIVPALEEASGLRCGRDFGLCYNPEFIALGSVISNMLKPDFLLIGESDTRSGDILENIYRSSCNNEPAVARMNFVNAELTKLSVNTFVTTKISYANMLANLCEKLPGADVDVVTAAIGNDSRIGHKYLKGALGYGGPCFPRDNVAFSHLARQVEAPALLAEATDEINRLQAPLLAKTVLSHLPKGGTVGILGLSYKPDTGVIEESQSIALAQALLDQGVPLAVYDPEAMPGARRVLANGPVFAASMKECARRADVLVIATQWEEFKRLSPDDLNNANGRPTIVDCWRILPRSEFERKANYVTLGRGPKLERAEAIKDPPCEPVCSRTGKAVSSSGQATRVLVTGAGGFIGHHLVTFLKELGYWVRGVDIKNTEFAPTDADELLLLDMRRWENCLEATAGIAEVYALAADMGGMGFISANHGLILHNNSLINTHTLEAARENGAQRYFYTSSACVYPVSLQQDAAVTPLKEEDAYPADPEDAYGWEKLIAERLCNHYRLDYGIHTRLVRFHNIFGPYGTWEGGREKAPAAMCRKIAVAKLTNNPEIEIWGDGEQTRSFCFIDDCVKGIYKLMQSDYHEPLNLGQDRLISINALADMVANAAGIRIKKRHVSGPQGVRGRNSDNTRLREVLGWEPQISLEEGMARTYFWIEEQVRATLATGPQEASRRAKDLAASTVVTATAGARA